MKKLFIILTILVNIFTYAFAQSALDEAEDFFVKDVLGNNHTLFSYLEEDKIVVLPFFTTTCGSCNIYTPEIVESFHDFGCNTGNVMYLGINLGSNNIGVIDFMSVHAVGYPCASGTEGMGNEVHEQYGIASNITALVVLPDGTIAGQFFGPNHYPTRDSLNNLLQSLGAEMMTCGVGIDENLSEDASIYPNPFNELLQIKYNNSATAQLYLKIYNIQGVLVRKQYLSLQPLHSINTMNLNSGMFFFQLIKEDKIILNQKLIKI